MLDGLRLDRQFFAVAVALADVGDCGHEVRGDDVDDRLLTLGAVRYFSSSSLRYKASVDKKAISKKPTYPAGGRLARSGMT